MYSEVLCFLFGGVEGYVSKTKFVVEKIIYTRYTCMY